MTTRRSYLGVLGIKNSFINTQVWNKFCFILSLHVAWYMSVFWRVFLLPSQHHTYDLFSLLFVSNSSCFVSIWKVFILSMTWVFAQLAPACQGCASTVPGVQALGFGWGVRGWGGTGGRRQGVFGVMWQYARSSASPVQPSVGLQTCERLSMPVQTPAKKRGLAVIRIDCLVLCLPIYIMDLSHSMMCFYQVLPH